MLEKVIRELPGVTDIDSVAERLEVRASVNYADPYDINVLGRYNPMTLDRQPEEPGDGDSQFAAMAAAVSR